MGWFEIISENYFDPSGPSAEVLAELAEKYRVVPHGVSLSIGGASPIDRGYIAKLKRLTSQLRPPWFSDHLCWSRTESAHLHDLFPLPYTRATAIHVADRIRELVDMIELPFAIENVSSYLQYKASDIAECDFLMEVAHRADCGILLDCNNIYVTCQNHGGDPERYIASIDPERVVQIHLAGHTNMGDYLLDTHSAVTCDEVWALYRRAIERCGAVSTLIEWDDAIPEWGELEHEAAKAEAIVRQVCGDKLCEPRRDDRRVYDTNLSNPLTASLASTIDTLATLFQEPEWPFGSTENAEALVLPGARLSACAQLEVYREQFVLRHAGSLAEDYPTVTRHLKNAPLFRSLYAGLARAFPPLSYQLGEFSAPFHAFLAQTPPFCDDSLLLDCAAFDWAQIQTRLSPTAEPLALASLQSLDEAVLPLSKIIFQPAIRLISLDHPVHEYRGALENSCEHADIPVPLARPTHLILLRRPMDYHVSAHEVPALAASLLARLMRGEALGQACESIANEASPGDDVGALIATWFQEWAANGWVLEVRPPS